LIPDVAVAALVEVVFKWKLRKRCGKSNWKRFEYKAKAWNVT
jgi:hypothetical protein